MNHLSQANKHNSTGNFLHYAYSHIYIYICIGYMYATRLICHYKNNREKWYQKGNKRPKQRKMHAPHG